MTVSGTNIDEIPDIIDTVVEHKADVFAFARYCPTSGEKDVKLILTKKTISGLCMNMKRVPSKFPNQ